MLRAFLSRIVYEIDMVGRMKWALHNGIAHPLMVVLPRTLGDWLHETTTPIEAA